MAAGSTYTPIATTTLGSTQTAVTFSSLGSYTDIVVVSQASVTSGAANWRLTFNGDSGTNYSRTYISGSGSAATSGRAASVSWITINDEGYMVAGQPTMLTIQVQNYSNTSTYKTVLSRSSNGSNNGTAAVVGLWRNTAAITSITLTIDTSTFTAGSTFTLYGIQAA
jgi:hypothetical protein